MEQEISRGMCILSGCILGIGVGAIAFLIIGAIVGLIVGWIMDEELVLLGICITGSFIGGIIGSLIGICLGIKQQHYLI